MVNKLGAILLLSSILGCNSMPSKDSEYVKTDKEDRTYLLDTDLFPLKQLAIPQGYKVSIVCMNKDGSSNECPEYLRDGDAVDVRLENGVVHINVYLQEFRSDK